ncbi:DUF2804 domain-containing protein [Nocardiopsis alkaliphila]|uniref:DUF2804 domain-containing protein n=1 Tax=Nocardiopsis alkaliphila TaxID=225762 RepID=UPI00034D04AC|nr:DUF2804 domain-containing protein [Nocardiopsis alkaliphila]
MPTHEPEITTPVDLTTPAGTLAPEAIGWSRTPLHRTAMTGWGRTKRWEYWLVSTPTHHIAITVADIDYLALTSVYLLDHPGTPGHTPKVELTRTVLRPLGQGVHLPPSLGSGPVGALGPIRARITDEPGGTRLRFSCATEHGPLNADLFVELPQNHQTMSVVIPWSPTRFQYTSKHTARPASGTVRLGEHTYDFTDAWGVLDHGRGRWPYDTHWNWGAASGHTDHHTVGLQFGGQWTQGTGLTENALCVDGHLTKIGQELAWDYDPEDLLAPWHLHTPGSDQVDVVFTPFHERADLTDIGVIVNDTHQCFGHYQGTVRTDEGTTIQVDHLPGFAEQVHMRW